MFKSVNTWFVFSIFIGVFAIFVPPANAWYTKLKPGQRPTHFLLTHLSSEALIHFRLYDQEAIYKGSNEPDDHGLQDHTASARRSYQSWNAATKKCRKGDRYWTVRRLARSFHYLQDYGDPTDYLRGSYKNHVRLMAHDMLMQGNWVKGNRQWQSDYHQFYKQAFGMSMKEILNFAKKEARQIGYEIKNQKYQDDRSIQMQLLKTFSLIAACQNRAVELLASRCQQSDPYPEPIFESQPRYDYGSEAAPRP